MKNNFKCNWKNLKTHLNSSNIMCTKKVKKKYDFGRNVIQCFSNPDAILLIINF